MQAPQIEWDYPEPFTLSLVVIDSEIDEYRHVNNAAYVRWLDRCAWAHSASLGVSLEDCLRMDRGMAVRRSELEYLAPAFIDDKVIVATWIAHSDQKLRVTRKFQIVAEETGKTLVRATVDYVCLMLSTGRPVRMPPAFLERYRPKAQR
ncbi:MAG TPA: thioesterase family protein [Steroidobacteraceae bacterium]|nr:thioesterase family protein [Steroidobacteraceae bacterium]